MSGYSGYKDGYGGGSYYGNSFISASGELDGPGTSAYETSDVPSGYVKTSYAYEGYYGNTYERDTIQSSDSYSVQTRSNYYANGNYYQSETYSSIQDGSFGYYGSYAYDHGAVAYEVTNSSGVDETPGSYFDSSTTHSLSTVYEAGGYLTQYESLSESFDNEALVLGSEVHTSQESYTNPFGYTTTYQGS